MHTRRVGAFLIGAWLIGTLLMAFNSSQVFTNIDRFFSNPPTQIAKELDDIGPDVMRQILRFQATQFTRHITETWEVIQLGLGGALLATSFLTAHRSRIVLIAAALMTLMVAMMYFHVTPLMNALARSYDFLPAAAAVQERESYNYYAVWYRVLDILKSALGIVITGRLLFDRYDWQDKLIPGSGGAKGVRRRRSHSPASTSSESVPRQTQSPAVGQSTDAKPEQADRDSL
jgi:hypothetical protein